MTRLLALFAFSLLFTVHSSLPAGAIEPPGKPVLKSSGTQSAPRPAEKKSSSVELPILSDPEPAPVSAPAPARSPAPALPPSSREEVEMYRRKAAEAMERGEWSAAEENLRAALRMDPDNAEIVLELSKVLMEQGKDDPALAVLAGYSGSDLRITQALGEAYVSTGRLREAEQVFMDLSLRQPAEAYHRYNLGLVEQRMGKSDMAEGAYLRAVDLDPNFADARYNLALLYIRGREYPKALAQLEEAVRLREDADYYINYGVVLRELNRFPVSQAALEKALAISPGNLLAMNNLGITHYTAGNMSDARKVFDDVLTSAPEDATARTYLAKIAAAGTMTRGESPAPVSIEEPPAPRIASEAKKPPETAPEEPRKKQTTSTRPVKPPETELAGDLDAARLRRENRELKERLDEMDKMMDEMKKGVYKQMVEDEKKQSRRVDSALKKAQEKLARKERELEDWSGEAADAGPAGADADRATQSSRGPRDRGLSSGLDGGASARLDEIQRTLAQARAEIEEVRRSQGPVTFSPEPGSTDERLDAADRAIQQLQRQIRQLTIERDMLRAELNSLGTGGGAPTAVRGVTRINVNLADLSSLLLVPGMEERLAHNILWYRQNIGPFKSVLDLKKAPGMDDLHYAQMLDFVSVGVEVTP